MAERLEKVISQAEFIQISQLSFCRLCYAQDSSPILFMKNKRNLEERMVNQLKTMREEIRVQDLILEVTRRCNMCCAHCLRGDAQCADMPNEVIDKVLDSVSEITSVTFTGGEPSLNIEAIRHFFRKAKELGKLPLSFYIVTNGKENQEELAIELLKWYPKMEEKDYCGAAISVDQYHEADATDPGSDILRGLVFYRDDKETDWNQYRLLHEGRAKDLENVRFQDWREDAGFYAELDDDASSLTIETLYVAANGNMAGSGDMSYERIDGEAVCTIDTFNEWVEGYLQEEAEKACADRQLAS